MPPSGLFRTLPALTLLVGAAAPSQAQTTNEAGVKLAPHLRIETPFATLPGIPRAESKLPSRVDAHGIDAKASRLPGAVHRLRTARLHSANTGANRDAALGSPAPAGTADATFSSEVGNHRTRRTETRPIDAPALRLGDVEVRPGGLVQVTGRGLLGRAAEADVFGIQRARLSLRATLGKTIEGFVRADLTDEPALLDASVTYRIAPAVEVAAGRFKTPFSYEYLTSSAGTDFVDRSRVVRALVPNRRVGVEATARQRDLLELTAGAFNGHGPDDSAEGARGRLLGVGRLAVHLPPAFARATGLRGTFGANVAAEDGPTRTDTVIVGGRAVVGVDGRVRLGRIVFAAEWIGETTRRGPDGADRSGYHATAAYDVALDHRLLARLDRFDRSNDLVLGYNASLHAAAAAQINLVVSLDDRAGPRRAALAAGVQVSF